jgi:hypothetical protein
VQYGSSTQSNTTGLCSALGFSVYGYVESTPPIFSSTAPFLNFQANELQIRAELWTLDGFCDSITTVIVPGGWLQRCLNSTA